ncbi:hypothetical protein [Leptospira ilyithenensis]|uniref:Uncharacterized protein n=1 Tax=Leptospira ilyithenensis TaxID=2484901 RepID=A0A4R9LSZ2_9LEPT|nr:hypothetical protein [Leptospira ilyithenensis]TGN14583.1 hypothetical protein EHS11_00915 [Leptospira ilyithenensis]
MLQKYRLCFLIFILSGPSFYCGEEGEVKGKERNQTQTQFLILISAFRAEGNCIKTTKQSSVEIVTCSRKQRGICNINLSLVTQSEVTFLLNETKKISDRTTDCQESILQSGLLFLKPTTQEEESSIKNLISYQTIDSCETSGFSLSLASQRLATYEELVFMDSSGGRIGLAAAKISANGFLPKVNRDFANSCLEKEFTAEERELFGLVRNGTVILEIEKR